MTALMLIFSKELSNKFLKIIQHPVASIIPIINASNEKVYYIMEALNDAINSRKKVSFQYFTFNVRKEQKLRHDGYTYVFSPFKLIWNSGS